MNRPFNVAVVGEVYVDHIFTDFDHVPVPGEEVFAEQYRREAGGGTVNTACAMTRLGHRASLFGVLGKDEEIWLKGRLQAFGVDSTHACSSELPNALTMSMSTKSDRSFLSYAGANRLLEEYVVLPETMTALADADHVHFAMPLSLESAERLLPALRSAGCTLSIDPGWRKEWFLGPSVLTVLRMFDLFLPNENEAQLLTKHVDVEEILHACDSLGLPKTILKLGARGAAALRDGRLCTAAPVPVEVVDTTGAGDAFDAGFLDAWLTGADVEEQLRRACICGSLSTRARGALAALPSRAEVMDLAETTVAFGYGEKACRAPQWTRTSRP